MEELWELCRYVQTGDVEAALALLDEMEGMSRDDKITRIRSYMKVLLTPSHQAGSRTAQHAIVGRVDPQCIGRDRHAQQTAQGG
jgi:pentatricopeptide repeat protein